jgi:hypothetical protein
VRLAHPTGTQTVVLLDDSAASTDPGNFLLLLTGLWKILAEGVGDND